MTKRLLMALFPALMLAIGFVTASISISLGNSVIEVAIIASCILSLMGIIFFLKAAVERRKSVAMIWLALTAIASIPLAGILVIFSGIPDMQ